MIPYQIDPSLHDSELPLKSLDDGFSPPAPATEKMHERGTADADADPADALGDKSPF